MSKITCYDSSGNVLDHYTQWDLNQKLIIRGADESTAPLFHFSNNSIKKTIVTSSVVRSDGIIASVPDVLLRTADPLIIHLRYSNGDEMSTKYSVRIPVLPKREPEDYIYSDGNSGIVLDNAKIIIDNTSPDINSVLWFDTGVIDDLR